MQQTDVIIIGGGAAGLFCAIAAGKRGRSVLLLEHQDRVGKKIAISGGGRCNFTNIHTTPENFISANPHFCKSALAGFTPADFISLVEKHGIAYHEKKLGQLFCDGSAQQIIDMLLSECAAVGVQILCGCRVLSVGRDEVGQAFLPVPSLRKDCVQSEVEGEPKRRRRFALPAHSKQFRVETDHGSLACSSLVIATGGLSIAPLGATDFGYRLARQFGLEIEEPRPGLVPFTLTSEVLNELSSLSGVSIDALVSARGKPARRSGASSAGFRENILITHRGLSGPAILQVSNYWHPGDPISIDLLPDEQVLNILIAQQESGVELATVLSQYLPKRFANAWCALYAPSRPLKQYNLSELQRVAELVHNLQIVPLGTEGFKKAEVTTGGVATKELSSQTMEARRVPGLYFIGEVVDVTGQLGGYNFQWAWASGYAAGEAV
jgi:predicted Rossmann fold flavoprotein